MCSRTNSALSSWKNTSRWATVFSMFMKISGSRRTWWSTVDHWEAWRPLPARSIPTEWERWLARLCRSTAAWSFVRRRRTARAWRSSSAAPCLNPYSNLRWRRRGNSNELSRYHSTSGRVSTSYGHSWTEFQSPIQPIDMIISITIFICLNGCVLQQESGQMCPILRMTLPYGIAYHHSGLTADERQLIEEAFLTGTLCCLCCTSTLAAGVNLPARRVTAVVGRFNALATDLNNGSLRWWFQVILRSPYMGAARLTRARYQQMIGRAGRAGFDTHGESIMIIKPPELQFITQEILLAPTDRVESQLAGDNLRGLQQLILSLIALDLGGKNRSQLAETVLHSTLIGQQVNWLILTVKKWTWCFVSGADDWISVCVFTEFAADCLFEGSGGSERWFPHRKKAAGDDQRGSSAPSNQTGAGHSQRLTFVFLLFFTTSYFTDPSDYHLLSQVQDPLAAFWRFLIVPHQPRFILESFKIILDHFRSSLF